MKVQKGVSDILSQAEIEALLSSLADAPVGSPALAGGGTGASHGGTTQIAARPSKGAIAYEVYDFRRPDKFSKEQLRTLQMLHETFARHSATALSAYLRCPVHIELISLEQIPYDEYVKGINTSVFTIMSLPPLTGQALLEMEFPIVFSMIDRLLGGPGRAVDRTVLTDIERPLVRQMVERVFGAFKTAWEGVVMINPGIEQMETQAQFVQIAPPNDIVVTMLFELRIGNMRGAMSVCVPYLVLKPIAAKLSAQKWFVSGSRKSTVNHKRILTQQIGNAAVDCSVQLGRTKVSVQDFLSLQVGDIVKLEQETRDDLRFLVGKQPKFFGKPGVSGKRVVFTISNVIDRESLCL